MALNLKVSPESIAHLSNPQILNFFPARIVTHSGRCLSCKLELRVTQKKSTSKKKVIPSPRFCAANFTAYLL
jgi:hypothetical protein